MTRAGDDAPHIRKDRVRGPYTAAGVTFAVLEQVEIDLAFARGLGSAAVRVRPLMVAVRAGERVTLHRLALSADDVDTSGECCDALVTAVAAS